MDDSTLDSQRKIYRSIGEKVVEMTKNDDMIAEKTLGWVCLTIGSPKFDAFSIFRLIDSCAVLFDSRPQLTKRGQRFWLRPQ